MFQLQTDGNVFIQGIFLHTGIGKEKQNGIEIRANFFMGGFIYCFFINPELLNPSGWQCFIFFPVPQGQRALRPILGVCKTRWFSILRIHCITFAGGRRAFSSFTIKSI